MDKILISACLVGDKTRYDGKGNYNPLIKELLKYYELVPFCPEVEGGLSIPREKSEIRNNKVIFKSGKDVTSNFIDGANKALVICKYLNIKMAILKDLSPSCSTGFVYNGLFNNMLVQGKGITASLLEKNGVKLYSEKDIEKIVKVNEEVANAREEHKKIIEARVDKNKNKNKEKTNNKNTDNKSFKNKAKGKGKFNKTFSKKNLKKVD